MNAETVGHAGTLQSKLLNTENIKMFRHPKYYKELRRRNKADTIKRRVIPGRPILDQAISLKAHDGECERATGPGLKPQAASQTKTSLSSESLKHQATSVKS